MLDVRGVYDLHIHSSPSLRPRIGTDLEIATRAIKAGLKGIMLKNHFESTVSRAKATQTQLNDLIKVYGGIVLNNYVGGFNQSATEYALKSGGKEVWMPTIDADNHINYYKSKSQSNSSDSDFTKGLTIFDENEQVKIEVKDILKLIAEYNAILGTCHLSRKEIFELVKTANKIGVKKILITHPYWVIPNLNLEDIKLLNQMGAIIELCFATIAPRNAYAKISQFALTINEIGSKNCILVTDAGQLFNPYPEEALRIFMQCLYEEGISEEDIYQMVLNNPEELVAS